MRYDAHETLVAPARASAGLNRLAGGILLLVPLFLVLSFAYATLLPVLFGPETWARVQDGVNAADTPTGVLINLATFGLLIVALGIVARIVHRRGLRSIIGPLPRAMRQFGRALGAMVLLYGVVGLIPMPESVAPTPNLAAATWAKFLIPALVALFLQVFAEELIFRGYLQSQLAARFASPVVWLAVPSVVFALLHFDVTNYGGNAWIVVAWAAMFGIVAGDLTARFGTLGPATALHFINNFSAILIAAPDGMFDGLALYSYPFALDDTRAITAMMPVDLLVLFCGWLAIRLALRG
ncbi:CPBP family intramembrane glutamic endopeptidase [Roseovarius sp. D22-M7]|uniref:CPBP family intramembrane glutamic endopeptidase n=1 Tax=Roseovarius sp. D22-M7 TaxID=3127116 RepID=UPI003010358F